MTSDRKQQLAAEDDVTQAERFVRNGEARVTQQAALLARWEQTGDQRQAARARQLLLMFERALTMADAHLQRERAQRPDR